MAFLTIVGAVATFVESTNAARTLHEVLGVRYHIDWLKITRLVTGCTVVIVSAVWAGLVLWRKSPAAEISRRDRLAIQVACLVNLLIAAGDIPSLLDRGQDPSDVWATLLDMAFAIALAAWLGESLRTPPFRQADAAQAHR
jgi:hypothetical protein